MLEKYPFELGDRRNIRYPSSAGWTFGCLDVQEQRSQKQTSPCFGTETISDYCLRALLFLASFGKILNLKIAYFLWNILEQFSDLVLRQLCWIYRIWKIPINYFETLGGKNWIHWEFRNILQTIMHFLQNFEFEAVQKCANVVALHYIKCC